jgi:hypothetical protein
LRMDERCYGELISNHHPCHGRCDDIEGNRHRAIRCGAIVLSIVK